MNDHSKNLIEIENLHFAYGTNQVLKGIQLAVPRGKVTFRFWRRAVGNDPLRLCFDG